MDVDLNNHIHTQTHAHTQIEVGFSVFYTYTHGYKVSLQIIRQLEKSLRYSAPNDVHMMEID